MRTIANTLGFLTVPLLTAAAPGAAWSHIEGRLEAPGLLALPAVEHETWITWYGPWDDVIFHERYPGPETTWSRGGRWTHTLMTRPAPAILGSRNEISQIPTIGGSISRANTRVTMQPGQSETFTLTLTDLSTPDFPYEPYLPTSISAAITVSFGHIIGNQWYSGGSVHVALHSDRGHAEGPLMRSVIVQSSFGWDAAAITAALQPMLADGNLDSAFMFPTFSFAPPSNADSAWYDFTTIGVMSPSPGVVGLLGAWLMAASRRRGRPSR